MKTRNFITAKGKIMDKKNSYFSKEQKETLLLVAILTACVFALLAMSLALFYSIEAPASNPDPKYVDIDNIEGMNINDAKAILEKAEITYEIVSADSKTPNRVEKLEFMGVTLSDTGRLRIKIGTSVKVYANVVEQNKIIYLTFDDGPTRDNTLSILDRLDAKGIKATFFVQGKNVANYPDRIVATVERGHLVGCHSYSHKIDEIYSSTNVFLAEIDQYEGAMKTALGEEKFASMSKVLRFPGGTTTNSVLSYSDAKEYLAAVRQKNYRVYDWTALTGDAEGYSTSEEFIEHLSTTLTSAKERNKPLIVLMHDKWSTNEELDKILNFLISEGYYFDTIDNCPEYTFAEN